MSFFKENKVPLVLLAAISLIFTGFLIFTFTVVQPGTFLSTLSAENMDPSVSPNEKAENWKPIPLASNFLSFFANGVSLPMIAPNIVKLLAHPALYDKAKSFWPAMEIIIIVLNIALFWFAFRHSSGKEKILLVLLILLMSVTISEVIIARPNHNIIPDFDFRYAGAPFYFYSLIMVVFASILTKIKSEGVSKTIISIVIVIFAAQQAFSFQAVRMKEESALREKSVLLLDRNLLSELDVLSKGDFPLVMPNLSGSHIFEPMPGFALADYLLFFDNKSPIKLIRNSYMPPDLKTRSVATVKSLRLETSSKFKEALKKSPIIKSYYASPSLMTYEASNSSSRYANPAVPGANGKNVIRQGEFDPEKINIIWFSLYTDDIPGNLELFFSFKNDFGVEGPMGRIRVDDYTPLVSRDGRRLYYIETNLLQLYTFSLSEKISDLTLHIPKTKNASLEKVYFR